MAHDIIGDIHGQAGKLKALLKHLGYRERMGAWRHPERSARFVGDLIDRGPGQLETLDIVRRMIDAGSAEAILGNHEFNAI
ncbi:MAG: metallophosphoesterase, partial [Stenotrophomonas sp.]